VLQWRMIYPCSSSNGQAAGIALLSWWKVGATTNFLRWFSNWGGVGVQSKLGTMWLCEQYLCKARNEELRSARSTAADGGMTET
jgi:hypothetical protein